MQRLRINFCRGAEVKFISHLDLIRLWQRALVRAGIALAYSEGFNPHPKLSLAAPLALGITSEGELMDIVLAQWSSPHSFLEAVGRQLPAGIAIRQVYNISPNLPSLQSQVRFAEYQVELETVAGQENMAVAIKRLLAMDTLPWQHHRDTGPRNYDLRALVNDIWLIEKSDGITVIGMKLRCDSGGSGRPEQVAAALGYPQYPRAIHRTRLVLQAG